MTSEPAFYVGLLLVFTGLACAGVGAFLGRRYRLIIAGGIPFVLAGALLAYVARERHRFRVTDVVISPVPDYVGRCPRAIRVSTTVSTSGGPGTVALRVGLNDEEAPPQPVAMASDVSIKYSSSVTLSETRLAAVYATVEAPSPVEAAEVFQVTCTAGG